MSKVKVEPEVADEELVQRARGGDGAALVDFASRWWPVIGRLAWSMLGNASQALVVTEEVMRIVLDSPQPPGLPLGRSMRRLAIWLAIIRRRASAAAVVAPASPVLQALDQLERMDRAAFLLRDVEQLSLQETAAVLESSPAEAQARVHRARVLLTHSLGDLASSGHLDSGFPLRWTA